MPITANSWLLVPELTPKLPIDACAFTTLPLAFNVLPLAFW